jgi:hypothetical protein
MTLDPATSLALSMHAHKGIYAILFGSGMSRAAKIPTAWEIIEDVVAKIAAAKGVAAETNLIDWYRTQFGKVPDYSEVLELVAPMQTERLSLLKRYFEPTEDERERGEKLPTAAHRAIAKLISRKYIKVVVTTNFDRLMEQALVDEGVNPVVVSSPDQIVGMMPLPHVDCLLVKLNGDYLDTRFKNTISELEQYDAETESLLDRIFTEYGLLVCGWSAEWDRALVRSITRNTRHRFTSYWMLRGEPGDVAKTLIAHRQAMVIKIHEADQAFQNLEATVEAVDTGRTADLLSPRIAVTMAKKYVSEPRFRIQLHDLVSNELAAVQDHIGLKNFPIGEPNPAPKLFVERVQRMEAICAKLVPLVATGVYWGTPDSDDLWRRCVTGLTLIDFRSGTSYPQWTDLHYYPATLVTYAAGLAAILKKRFDLIRILLMETSAQNPWKEKYKVASAVGSEKCLRSMGQHLLNNNPGLNHKTPGSEWMVTRLRAMLADVFGRDIQFEDLFDRWEILLGMLSAEAEDDDYWAGRFGWRGTLTRRESPLLTELHDEVTTQHLAHPYLAAGMFEGKPEKLLYRIQGLRNIIARIRY